MDEADFSSSTDEPDGPKRPSPFKTESLPHICDCSLADRPDQALRPIELSDKPQFDSIFSRLSAPVSDYAFAGTYIWGSSLKVYWASIDRHLCIFANGTGDLTMLLPPLPESGATSADLRDCVENCFEIMDRYNDLHAERARSRIEYVSDEMLERFSATPGLTLSAAPMAGDYVYDMARMIDLAGGNLKSKRHAKGKFMRDFPDHRTEPLDERHIPACRALLDLWVQNGDAAHEGEVNDAHVGTDVLRHRDRLASHRALDTWRELGLTGMALLVGEQVVGFTLGEALSPSQAFILIEKTHPDFPGSAQFIFSEFCRQYWSEYPECNVGDDWGIPSLRFTKQSYRPIRMLSKYTLTRQPALVVAGFSPLDVPNENPPHTVGHSATPAESTAACGSAESHAMVEQATTDCCVMRAATCDDVTAILEIERVCFSSLEETFNRRQIRALIANPRATVTVAECDGRVVGWSVGLVRSHRKSRSGRLYAIAVHPDARGKHLGRRLAEHTLQALGALGIERVYLEVRSDNESAIALYRKLGFHEHRFLPKYYGPGRDAYRMKHVIASTAPATSTEKPAAAE
jgi:ribosomal protein S18 acetylase RimI-like enzyme